MQVVYRAENIIDAHLAKGLLEQAGLLAFVLGEHLGGGIGELPAMGLMAVSVADSDVDAANAVLAEWRRATPRDLDARDSEAIDGDWLPQPG